MFGRRRSRPKPPPPPCPECGKPTNLGGRYCRACGWDADHFGSEDAYLDGVSVPEPMDDDAYEERIRDEGLAEAPVGPRRWPILWWLAAVLLILAFALTSIPGF